MRPDHFTDLFSDAALDRCGPAGLAEGERVLLWMLRQWAAARVLREEPGARLSKTAGALISPRLASAFILMMSAIEGQVRRPLRFSTPGCRSYVDDEQRLIVACGVSPASSEMADRLIEGLVIAPEAVTLMAHYLNAALAQEGMALPMRLDEPVIGSAPLRPRTLH